MNLQATISAKDNASPVVAGFGGSLNKIGGTLTSLAGTALKFGAVAATALTTAAGFAVKSAADIQMMRVNLDTLLGSADAGSAMFKKLYDMAAKTPFETADLVGATKEMLAMGIAAENIMPDLQLLGDISLGNKDIFQRLTYTFSQIQSATKLTGDNLRELTAAGFNPLQIQAEKLAKETGISIPDAMTVMRDKMEDGAFSADMVTEAMKIATSEGGRFHDGMLKGSQTLTGIWSTLMDSVGMLSRSLVGLSETGDVVKGGLFDKISNAVTYLNTLFVTHKAQIDTVASSIANGLTVAINWLVNAFITTYNWLIMVKNEIVAFFTQTELGQTIMTIFKALIDNIVDSAGRLWKVIVDNKAMFIQFAQTIGAILIIAILALVGAVDLLINIIGVVIQTIGWFRNVLNDVSNLINNSFTSALNFGSSMLNSFEGNFWSLINAVREAWNWLDSIDDKINNMSGGVIGKIRGVFGFQTGGIVPATGMYQLHAGEIVRPSGSFTNGGGGTTIIINGGVNNTNGLTIEQIEKRLARQLQLSRQGAY